MHKLEVPELKITIDFPEDLMEMNEEQYLEYFKLLNLLLSGHIDLDNFSLRLVYSLLKMERSKSSQTDIQISNLVTLMDLVSGFFESDGDKKIPVTFCPIQKVPKIGTWWFWLKGPDDALADCSIGQFIGGLELVEAYHKSNEPKFLKDLVLLLYCQQSKIPGTCRFWKPDKMIEQLPRNYFTGVYYFFMSCVDHITQHTVSMENGREYDFRPLFGKASGGRTIGPRDVIFTLAENKVFGSVKETQDQNLYEILIYLLRNYYKKEDEKKKDR